MSPASGPVTDPKLFPAAVHEDQEAILMTDGSERTVLSAPPFSSPDPATDARRMLPLEDGSSAHQSAVEAAEIREATTLSDYNSLSPAELKELAEERDLEIEGTGKGGNVKKSDYVSALEADDLSDMKAADFKELVANATTQDELDEAAGKYADSEKSYASVEDAIEKRQDELDAEADNANEDDDNNQS